jgi:pyocin large subunit-like protein
MNKTLAYLLLVVGLGCLTGCSSRQATRAEANRNESPAAQATSPPPASTSPVGFASREKLLEHYHKHGREFGNVSLEEYLLAAQTLRDHAAVGTIIEAVRADGVITRFDRESGTFIAFNRNGVIRTCFKPNEGERYFRRQLKRKD